MPQKILQVNFRFSMSKAEYLNAPGFSEVNIQPFDILDELTQITRGPIQRTAQV